MKHVLQYPRQGGREKREKREREERGDGSLYSSYHTCRQNGNISLLLLARLIVPGQTKMSAERSELREEGS